VIRSESIPIKLWIDKIELKTLKQIKNLANLPFVFGDIIVMPNCYQKYNMPTGIVLGTIDVLIPHAIGNDIGCGVCAIKTSLTNINNTILKRLLLKIQDIIPIGFNNHKIQQNKNLIPTNFPYNDIVESKLNNSYFQIGTLGNNDHFIEFQKDEDDYIWIMIHSGSRKIGKEVTNYYNKKAIEHNIKWYSKIPAEYDLAFLPINCEIGKMYFEDMNFCIMFAQANRKLMMTRIKECINEIVTTNINFNPIIDVVHNYAILEKYNGFNLIIHRKDAIRLYENETGILPGNQGSYSYIIKGKKNDYSFNSCSHGTGCKLNSFNTIHTIKTTNQLDNAPGTYKDITNIINQQLDLFTIAARLKPIATIKA